MSTATISAFETSGQKSEIWLHELAEIGPFDDEQQAYSAMRAVLHCLRDRVTVDEAAHVSAQLPLLIRGVFFEGWKPSATPRKLRTRQEFLGAVAEALRGTSTSIRRGRWTPRSSCWSGRFPRARSRTSS